MFSHLWYIMQTSQHVDNIWVEHGMIQKASVNTKWWNVQKLGGKMMLKWSCYQRRSGNQKKKDGKIKKVWVELSVKFLFLLFASRRFGRRKKWKNKNKRNINQTEWIIQWTKLCCYFVFVSSLVLADRYDQKEWSKNFCKKEAGNDKQTRLKARNLCNFMSGREFCKLPPHSGLSVVVGRKQIFAMYIAGRKIDKNWKSLKVSRTPALTTVEVSLHVKSSPARRRN